MSLLNCLAKAGKVFTKEERRALYDDAQKRIADGASKDEAETAAVEAALKEAKADRQEVLDMVAKAVPGFDAGTQESSPSAPAARRRKPMASRSDVTKTEAFNRWFADSKVVDKEGNPLRVYHGAKRLDRMGPHILKSRATSGPMPFFTDDQAIASGYATGKQDTSLPEEDRDYNAWFRLKVPGARNPVNIDRAWFHLPAQEREKIASLAPRVGRDYETGEKIMLYPEGHNSGLGGYDQHIKEASGNHLRALVEEWLNSGSLYDSEDEFMQVLKLAGVDASKVEMHSPWAEYPGVLPVYLSIKNPLRTSDIPQSVVDALQKRSYRQGPAQSGGADIWAKETRDAREWMTHLREDLKDQKNSHAWTSIPDWVTDTLKKLGYDGIIDTGGKLGGQEHGVYIPFEPTQIKSAIGNKGTFDPNKRSILASRQTQKPAFERTEEGPVIVGKDGVGIVQPSMWETRHGMTMYEHTIAQNGEPIGVVTLGWIGDKVAFLPNIRLNVHERSKGVGESVIRSLVEHNGPGQDLTIGYIAPSAREFWSKMGVRIEDTDEGTFGQISLESHRDARPVAESSDAQRSALGEGTEAGREEQSPAAKAQGLKPEQVRSRLIEAFGPKIDALIQDRILNIVETPSDLPQNLRSVSASSDEAWYDPNANGGEGGIYMIASQLTPERVVPVLLHELGEHYNLPKMLGSVGYANLQRELRALHARGVSSPVEDAWRHVTENYPDLKETSAEFAAEVIAKVGETAEGRNLPIYRRVLNAVKAFLLKLGLKLDMVRNLSDEDLRLLVETSARQAIRRAGEAMPVRGGPMAARNGVGQAFNAIVEKLGRNDVAEILYTWNESELSEDGDGIVAYPGRDGVFSKGKEGGNVTVSKREFLDWLASDAPFDPSVYTFTESEMADWRKKIESARDAAGLSGRSIMASRGAAEAIPSTAFASARQMFDTVTRSDRTLNRVISKFNTPFHIAETHPEFKPVYQEAQDFNQDVSRVANETADLAPDLLPRIESFSDFKKSAPSNADISATANALYAGTLWGNGSPMEGRAWTDEELKSGRAVDGDVRFKAFEPLNDAQIKLYRQALASVGHSLTEHAKSLVFRLAKQKDIQLHQSMSLDRMVKVADEMAATQIEGKRDAARDGEDEIARRAEREIEELEAFRKSLEDIKAKTDGLIEHGYFPAMRFGAYAVNVQTMGEDGKWKEEYFGRFETQAAANLTKAELQSEYPKGRVTSGVMNEDAHKLFQGLNLDALELFSQHMKDDNGKSIATDPLMQEYFRVATTERSSLKRQIHRKGTPGFSRDVPRALAQFTVSNATSASRNYHAADMLAKVQKIKAGDLQAYATRYVRYLQDPQEENPALRGFLANYYILGSIAFGAVNMTQPVLMTAPYLSAHTSWANAMKQLGKAAKDIVSGRANLTADEKAAYEKATKAGIVSPQEIHQIRAESRASMMGDSPLWQKLEGIAATKGITLPGKLLMRKAAFLWGSIYSMTEQFNRGTTFLAAYRIGKANNEDAYEFAKNTVDATQGVYARSNRPEVSRGNVGSVLMTFKQFNISYLELAKRLYKQDKKAFAILMLTLTALAGAEGLPFAEDIEDLIDTIGQWMGYSTNSKKKLRKLAVSILGKDIADIMLHGASAIPGVPIDVANRMGMHNIIPGSAMMKTSEPDKTRDIMDILGPAAALFKNVGAATQGVATGKFGETKQLLPSAIQNVLKGAEMVDTGQYKDMKGRKVMDVDGLDAFVKLIGFQPSKIAAESRIVSQNQQDIALQKVMESSIADQWAHGIIDKDQNAVKDARDRWREWNATNPELRIKIDYSQISRRVKDMRTSREERFLKTAPKEIRNDVARDLRP